MPVSVEPDVSLRSSSDLPERIAKGWPLNPVDPSSMYGGTEKGYSDYPTYAE